MLYVTINLTCDIIAHRYVELFSFTLVASFFIYPITYLINDIVAEIFGYNIAKNMIWLGVLADFLFSFLLVGTNKLPAPHFWQLKESFIEVLDPTLRLSFGTLVGVIAGRFLNIYLLSRSKVLLNGNFFWARAIIASCIGLYTHAIILNFITYYGTIPNSKFISLMLTNLFTNVSSIVLFFWIPTIVVEIIKSRYSIDTYDENISYNPLLFK